MCIHEYAYILHYYAASLSDTTKELSIGIRQRDFEVINPNKVFL